MNAAAIDWAYYYHPTAMREKREYISNILKSDSGKYYYEPAIPGGGVDVDFPDNPDRVGWIHSHHSSDYSRALMFALEGDIRISEKFHVPGYVVTPAGNIQRYDPLGDYGGDEENNPLIGRLSWVHYDWWGLGNSVAFEDFKREKLEKEMERWKYRRDHPEEPHIQHVQSNSWWCTIM